MGQISHLRYKPTKDLYFAQLSHGKSVILIGPSSAFGRLNHGRLSIQRIPSSPRLHAHHRDICHRALSVYAHREHRNLETSQECDGKSQYEKSSQSRVRSSSHAQHICLSNLSRIENEHRETTPQIAEFDGFGYAFHCRVSGNDEDRAGHSANSHHVRPGLADEETDRLLTAVVPLFTKTDIYSPSLQNVESTLRSMYAK